MDQEIQSLLVVSDYIYIIIQNEQYQLVISIKLKYKLQKEQMGSWCF